MDITRKKGINKIHIYHNKILFLIIILLIILLIFVIIFLVKNRQQVDISKTNETCQLDSDCVPNSCCHATGCINKLYAEGCESILCSMECSGPLDCGAGYCGCLDNKCEVIANN